MKNRTNSFREITNLMSKNESYESYFSNYFMSKNNMITVNKKYTEAPFVVEWQMENEKHDI